jgi:hypothetical protein
MELPQFWGFGRVKVIVHLIICSVYGLNYRRSEWFHSPVLDGIISLLEI